MLQQIVAFLQRAPFAPFAIVTTSGSEYRGDHPENAAIVAGRVVVALPGDVAGVVTLARLHIAEIKDFSKNASL